MKLDDFSYTVVSDKKFSDSVVSVLKSIDKKGWSVFGVYDIQERLASKNFESFPLKIVEFCSAKHASSLLSKNKLISLCMPCKIVVFEDSGTVKIASVKPSILSELFNVPKTDAEAVEKDIKEIVDLAK